MGSGEDEGFTLIELTVVIAIVTIVFFFSIPRLQNEIVTDPAKKTTRWLLANVHSLKERSSREKTDYVLYIDTDNHTFRMSQRTEASDEASFQDEATSPTTERKYQLPESMRITDVQYPGNIEVSTGVAEVIFYSKGYSDSVYIHMEDDRDRRFSFLIEPFLPLCRFFEERVGFEG